MAEITLLDGGMGQELIHRAGDRPTPLWSTQVMMDMPGIVQSVHEDYYRAGASVATTNTYAIHRDRLRGASNHYAVDGAEMPNIEDKFEALHDAALTEACAARDAVGSGRIAGSIGPLGASYRADLHPDHDTAVPLYREVAGLIGPRVDVLLCETVASLDAARSALVGALAAEKPVWISVTIDDEDGTLLRSGEKVADLAAILKDGAAAALANCSAPEAMPAALEQLAKAGLPFGAYGNGFTMITKAFLEGGTTAGDLRARQDMGPENYADHAMSWVDMGATILGGCCETGPAHIAEIARRLREAEHRIV
ncbi:Homocysteine S-methyltransferase [Pelagimonas phthalicica]|uniref:Homocysteine S-methyltransferase n=1 Tax=Pelagimonas phthalicica TaxID=1037362 RepID=A0A238J9I2_9RHOB|nr:homocysteine S-methyltransferase family protein [Pelagimonas phthalicica]TDS94438.1 homocysteine S-methyltransferase [Pelagimonas phthalicica]SMX27035.1 Homocysteine S-methyltransferase [Pelagimonas phthalicica]